MLLHLRLYHIYGRLLHLGLLHGLESHNLRRDIRLKIICRRLYITTKFYTYHFCHRDCSLQCQNVGL